MEFFIVIVEQNNNPTYQPNDFNSVVEALRQALVNKEGAKLDEDYALTFCNPKQIAQQHLDLYTSILKLSYNLSKCLYLYSIFLFRSNKPWYRRGIKAI